MPAASELIAHGRSNEEICELIGADKLIYQDLPDLIAACREGNPAISEFDCSVFDGRYIAGRIDRHYLDSLEQRRSDTTKQQKSRAAALASNETVDLHNGN